MTSSLPKLAVLDDYQSISHPIFSPLASHLSITYIPDTLPSYTHPSTTPSQKEELITRLKPYTIISCMRERTPFPSAVLHALPNLKLLLTTGMRNAAIDLEAAKELGITVTGTAAHPITSKKKKRGPDSTTQHTVAMILALARNIAADNANVQAGKWQTSTATSLSGKTFATLGLGRLGGNTAKIMHDSFGMDVICWSSSLTQDAADEKARELGLPVEDEDGDKTFKVVSKKELFEQADVLSVHYVLSDRSRGIVGAPDLALMKKSAFLVNSSRGPLVDEGSLFEVLEKGGIAGAAVDVFEIEPLGKESQWRSAKWGEDGRGRVLVTPHMGYVDREGLEGWYREQIGILEAWVKAGEKVGEGVVNVLNL